MSYKVNLITALGFSSMTRSIESVERIERAHELVTTLNVEVFPGPSRCFLGVSWAILKT